MKSAKTQCNRVTAEAKKTYWAEFCKSEVLEYKDIYKIWKKKLNEKWIQIISIAYQIRKQ